MFRTSKLHLQYLHKQLQNEFNPLNAKLNSICHLLALLGAHPILHISRIRVKDKHTNMCTSTSWYEMVDWDFILSMG